MNLNTTSAVKKRKDGKDKAEAKADSREPNRYHQNRAEVDSPSRSINTIAGKTATSCTIPIPPETSRFVGLPALSPPSSAGIEVEGPDPEVGAPRPIDSTSVGP